MVESSVIRDVARTYREALQREGKDLPARNMALKVYLGHFPTVSHDAGPSPKSSPKTPQTGNVAEDADLWRLFA